MARISIDFTGRAAETLVTLATEQGVPVCEVVRQAIAREAWYRGVLRDGGRIYVLDTVGRMCEVDFVR